MNNTINTTNPIKDNVDEFCMATPKREALLLSPSALIQVGASPVSKRYNSMRKIDFENGEKKSIHASAKRLDFFK